MAVHNKLGANGEREAVVFLRQKGHRIICTNYRYQKAEIDIISESDNRIVFTEVKTRSTGHFGDPVDSVNRRKEMMIAQAADNYIISNNIELEARFDLVSVIIRNGKSVIRHVEDAFYPFDDM